MFQCFILHVTTSKNVLHKNICKNVGKHFTRLKHGLKIDSGYMYNKTLAKMF